MKTIPYNPFSVEVKMDSKCPKCNSDNFVHHMRPLAGYLRGSVRCNDCNYSDSFINYIGKQICVVQSLPETNTVIYDKETSPSE